MFRFDIKEDKRPGASMCQILQAECLDDRRGVPRTVGPPLRLRPADMIRLSRDAQHRDAVRPKHRVLDRGFVLDRTGILRSLEIPPPKAWFAPELTLGRSDHPLVHDVARIRPSRDRSRLAVRARMRRHRLQPCESSPGCDASGGFGIAARSDDVLRREGIIRLRRGRPGICCSIAVLIIISFRRS